MERRCAPRIAAAIEVKFLVNDTRSASGAALDLSASGIAISSDEEVALGDRVVLHFSGGVRLEGEVARVFAGGFALSLVISKHKSDQINALVQAHHEREETLTRLSFEKRIATRISGLEAQAFCQTDSGAAPCRIVDLSMTGVAIETDADMALGASIKIGHMRGKIVRRDGEIYGIRFATQDKTSTGADDAASAPAAQ